MYELRAEFALMKQEFRVIAHQHGAVKFISWVY